MNEMSIYINDILVVEWD